MGDGRFLIGLKISRPVLLHWGLYEFKADGEYHWALLHDVLGRFLLNALFHDYPMRERLGFAAARDPEHLRFLLLRRISQKDEIGN